MKTLLLRSRSLLVLLALLLSAPALWSCNSETEFEKSAREHVERYKVIDNDTIQSYLRRNNYLGRFQQTSSGLYIVSLNQGTGAPVVAGKQVQVKYIGRFMSNSLDNVGFAPGSIFDNSSENRTDCGCAIFTAGSGAIAGFSEGLLTMRVGDRKLLLIPSRLAYGPGGQVNSTNTGYTIPPDAVLAFDIEVLSVFP